MRNIIITICVALVFAGCAGVQMNIDGTEILAGMGARGAGVGLGLALKDPAKVDMAVEYLRNTATGAKDVDALKAGLDWGMGWVNEQVSDPLLKASINDLYTAIDFKKVENDEGAEVTAFNLEFFKANLPLFLEGLSLSKSYMK